MNQHVADSAPSYAHAIVIGSSIAGLAAARVLTDYFEHVTIIERDVMPETPEFRKGVPHTRHAHVLMYRGQVILEQLFPGLTEETLAAGATLVNMGTDVRWYVAGQWRPRYESEINILACSRPLLETTIYRRVAALPKVRFLQNHEVVNLMVNDAGTHVAGVQVRARSTQGEQASSPAAIEHLTADFVLDASGRDSHAPAWLAQLGFDAPQETVVNAFPGYATRIYERPAGFESWKMMFLQAFAGYNQRGAVVLPLEHGHVHVTLLGMNGDHPSTDEHAFLEFARSLPELDVYTFISQAKPLTPIWGYRRAENRLRHYHELPRHLEGFAVCGDAVCGFSPVYGQGMTTAALASTVLDQCLREQQAQGSDLTGLASRFQEQLVQAIGLAWQMATSEDSRWPNTEGRLEADPANALLDRYMGQVVMASMRSPEVAEAFYRVSQLVDPPTLFFRPDIVLHVFNSVSQPAEPVLA